LLRGRPQWTHAGDFVAHQREELHPTAVARFSGEQRPSISAQNDIM